MLLPENYCSTSLFTTGYKRLAEGAGFDGEVLIGWLPSACEAAARMLLLLLGLSYMRE
jgi:hypothetical protein